MQNFEMEGREVREAGAHMITRRAPGYRIWHLRRVVACLLPPASIVLTLSPPDWTTARVYPILSFSFLSFLVAPSLHTLHACPYIRCKNRSSSLLEVIRVCSGGVNQRKATWRKRMGEHG